MARKRKQQDPRGEAASAVNRTNEQGDIEPDEQQATTSGHGAKESRTEHGSSDPQFQRKKRRLHAHERAQQMYEKIHAERRLQSENRRKEEEARKKALESYLSTKKKMDRALLKRNKRGQPNLNAQVEVLLEKIQKRAAK